jgi:hypothetical protein
MALNTYNFLLAGIQNFLEDNDAELTASVPDVINLAEIRLVRDLDLSIFRRINAALTLTIGNPVGIKPTISGPDLLVATKGIWLTGGTIVGNKFLEERSYEFLIDYNSGAANGIPKYFAEIDEGNWYFAVPPLAAYVVHLRYLSRPNPLTVANQTNWLSTYASDLLFKASLAEAEKFLKADERSVMWSNDYNDQLPQARRELVSKFSNQVDRVGATAVPQAPRSQVK